MNIANLENALTMVRELFWVNLSKSFDLHETLVTGVFEVPEFDSCVKIEVEPFFVDLGSICAGNLGII